MPAWVSNLLQNICANIVSAIIVIPLVFWIFKVRGKVAGVGKFKAFVVKADGTEQAWGDVRLSYNLLSNRIRGTITRDEIVIDLEGQFDRSQYLRGHYIESSNAARRRLGAFLYILSGDSTTYTGPFAFVDPDDKNNVPQTAVGKWVRVP